MGDQTEGVSGRRGDRRAAEGLHLEHTQVWTGSMCNFQFDIKKIYWGVSPITH